MDSKQSLKEIYDQISKTGRKTSDLVTAFIGSWWFIMFFAIFVAVWIGLNAYFLFVSFDPFPFILLNLTLSLLAAIQAPLIMMSQNRQMEYDRTRNEVDYLVNLRAEKKIEEIEEELRDIKNMIRKDTIESRKQGKE